MRACRFLAMTFAILFLLSGLPVSVNAETNAITEDYVNRMAAEAFPEFADKILKRDNYELTLASAEDPDDFTIVYSETRKVSETESVTYQEYANGQSSSVFIVSKDMIESSSGSGYSCKEINIYVTSTVGYGCLMVSGFTYTLVSGGYDRIDDFGTTRFSNIDAWQDSYALSSESATRAAFAQYYGDFPSLSMPTVATRCTLTVRVGGDQCTISTTASIVNA